VAALTARSGPLVHEVAHIFHNCKRRSAGLPETRRKQWLLEIAFRKRETFAHACEFYSCILRHSADAAGRRHLALRLVRPWALSDDRVDAEEVADIVLEAAWSRAGWKVIRRRRCEPVSGAPRAPTVRSLINYRRLHATSCIAQALLGPNERAHARPPGS
jgi:hypothetical protein